MLERASEARDQFREAIRVFRQGSPTQDTLMRLWQTRYNVLGLRVGLKFEVPDLDYYQDEIEGLAHMSPARKLVYVADELEATPQGLVLLSRMYRKMRAAVEKPDTKLLEVTHISNKGGWVHVESNWQNLNTDTTQSDLENKLAALNEVYHAYIWSGQRLATYVIGSQDSHDLTRPRPHYFDEGDWARLLGSFLDDKVLYAGFHSDGRLYFVWSWNPQDLGPYLSGRFEGTKPSSGR